MSYPLSNKLNRFASSASVAAKARVMELEAAGKKILDFCVGEPDFVTPTSIIEAARTAALAGQTRYTATTGTKQLKTAVQRKFKRDNGLDYSLAEIVVGSGAKQLIYTAFTCTVDDGDEVIIPAPYWVSYPDIVKLNGGVPVILECPDSQGFKLKPEQLEAAITPKTKWLVLNSPNNPSGAIYSEAEMQAIADVLVRHPHVWLMTDEIYEYFNYAGATLPAPAVQAPELKERTLVINGVSKAYAMTGWRIGYAGGPLLLIKAMDKLMSQSIGGASAVSQAAAVAALEEGGSFVEEAARVFGERRNLIIELLNDVPGLKCLDIEGAFYAYPNCGGLIGKRTPDGVVLQSDLDVRNYLLESANVAVLDGAAYGLSPYLRLSFATSTEIITEGCRRMKEACQALS
ncbi:Aminotransferase, s I/II [Pseudomonas savastanoi pv. glycinea]|uniref:aminotransferase class I/II-fold pyridoxal phosphate-dependent enzyme n=1 Tax=Pseudomonas quasicaspiana TaxID=2829821 RepID=UPI000F00C7FE|nr:aminotransferase class I/II-fold pyridoxal phosphate-dependent enzyme [Pseudomonas quasicaspiana]MCD5972466.1 aminotransferase class I/II-fold pyridoxal phosphate-dependent enzyme [Pseudomonas quasicaspiana]MCQ2997604.1 aminotransferase class I/II-fold pyridoxal phosphate-dependent enzyme [Pseudomonas syringae]MCQ3031335.1 aminotransferase class I/II-fold pyridoxal phosphate-dependent enzyme [Pseudomonas syringae]RMR03868.1 Aminotransferase, s I/II [Pseudomonas savastanoi pv. glycinea]